MPTYQYACTACGQRLEVVQSFTDEALTECPACAGRLRKLFSAVGIVFKGSGFYRTDSRPGEKVGAEAGKSDGAKSDAAKSDGAKSDGAKADGGKSDGAKSDSGGTKKEPAGAGTSSGGSATAPAATK